MQPGSFHKGRGGIYRCVPFEQFKWLDHGFSTRGSTGLPAPITTLKQIHSGLVRDARDLGDRCAEGDALVSNGAGKSIGIRTADCVPILLVDARLRAVAAIHAGWRGTSANIVGRTVERLIELFRTNPDDVYAAIGPAIGACCYQVAHDVAVQFTNVLPGLVGDGEGRVLLDLPEVNRRLLLAAGVPGAQIYGSGLCTFCNFDDFFSYRRDRAEPGRMISFVSIKK